MMWVALTQNKKVLRTYLIFLPSHSKKIKMTKITPYILLFLFTLPIVGIAQSNNSITNDEVTYKNQIDLDIEALAFSFSYKKRVHKNWFIGPNIGAGLGFQFIYDKEGLVFSGNTAVEIAHIGFVFKYAKHPKFQFEIEPKISGLLASTDNGTNVAGVGFNLYYGNKLQFGIKTMAVFFKASDKKVFTFSSNFLTLRIPLKW